jgi:hypothetical protein
MSAKKILSTLFAFLFSIVLFTANAQNEDFSFDCDSGPGGCSVVIETYVVNIPRDVNDMPVSPFVYNIPSNPTDGQFRVVAQYRTRGTADARSVSFNGTPGTGVSISYGTELTWGTSFKAEFTTGNISSLELIIDSDPVAANDLPALEVLVFKCTTTRAGPVTGVYPDEFNWVGAPGNTNPSCKTRTLTLSGGSCTQDRQLTMTTGIFNIHQDNPGCQREIYMEYKTNGGQTFSFVEAPAENNSEIEHVITVPSNTTEIEINVCTWNQNMAPAEWNTTCLGASHGWGYTLAADACGGGCGTPCDSPNCGTVTVIKN